MFPILNEKVYLIMQSLKVLDYNCIKYYICYLFVEIDFLELINNLKFLCIHKKFYERNFCSDIQV